MACVHSFYKNNSAIDSPFFINMGIYGKGERGMSKARTEKWILPIMHRMHFLEREWKRG